MGLLFLGTLLQLKPIVIMQQTSHQRQHLCEDFTMTMILSVAQHLQHWHQLNQTVVCAPKNDSLEYEASSLLTDHALCLQW